MNCLTHSIFVLVVATVVMGSPLDKDEPAFSCPAGERYEKCSPVICYKNCSHLKNSHACASVSSDCFQPACVCEENYLRNAEGVCIRLSECPEYISYNR